jgi:hypothetical protein
MDCGELVKTGEIVFCAEVTDCNEGVTTLEASREPNSKNMSGEKILRGWCGSTNNVALQATGAGIVRRLSERMDENGDPIPRCQLERLPDSDERVVALCNEMGVTE